MSEHIPQISVIVPVYNAEKYLHRCIDSILVQTFADFELLLIDDGSPDRSGAICDEYAQKDSRICVFHKPNGGVSSARNLGLDNAKGEWISFVDSDDEIPIDGLANLAAGSNYGDGIDFVSAGYIVKYLYGGSFSTAGTEQDNKILDLNSSIRIMYRDKFYQFYVFTKLFKRKIIERNRLRFDETLYYSEDRLFIINYLCLIYGKTFYTSTPVYYYILRETGAMMSITQKFDYKSVTGFDATCKMYQCLKSYRIKDEIMEIARFDVIDSYFITRQNMNKFKIKDKEIIRGLNNNLRHFVSLEKYFWILIKTRLKLMISSLRNSAIRIR